MNTVFRQPSIHEQRTLGGSVYSLHQAGSGDRIIDAGIRFRTAPMPFKSQGHFAPVASEDLLKNRQPAIPQVPSRGRILPVVKAPAKPIVQAEIDDAFEVTLMSEIEDLMLDYHKSGWDGYGAEAVSMDGYHAAQRFIHILPPGIPHPEVAADPDGCVTFEWRKSPRRTLLVSVSPGDTVDYAALIDTAKAHGSEAFSEELSETLKSLIRRIIGT